MLLVENFAFTFLDEVNAVTQVTLLEDDIARLEMLIPDAGFKGDLCLRQLRREQQMEEPVGGDPNLAVKTRHLHQIDATPQAPCE